MHNLAELSGKREPRVVGFFLYFTNTHVLVLKRSSFTAKDNVEHKFAIKQCRELPHRNVCFKV